MTECSESSSKRGESKLVSPRIKEVSSKRSRPSFIKMERPIKTSSDQRLPRLKLRSLISHKKRTEIGRLFSLS